MMTDIMPGELQKMSAFTVMSHLPQLLALPGGRIISRLAGDGLRPTRQNSTFCLALSGNALQA